VSSRAPRLLGAATAKQAEPASLFTLIDHTAGSVAPVELESGYPDEATAASGTINVKDLGAYYTDTRVAQFLVRWSIVTGSETVLDPSSGEGVFLAAAAQRIRELGGDPRQQVFGIEIDSQTNGTTRHRLVASETFANLLTADFFTVEPGAIPYVDAIVGNPPFIRYQRFGGESRHRALQRAKEAGVRLSKLSSSWAPFLVHATRFVKPGGSLAMVAPAELSYATYARPLLDYLCLGFETVHILTFAKKLFPHLSEDTIIILAAGRGKAFKSLELVDVEDFSELAEFSDPGVVLARGVSLDRTNLVDGTARILHYLLPEPIRALYEEIGNSENVARLGSVADVGIGYVTGDNEFFHLTREIAEAFAVPPEFLRPAVRSGSDFAGLRFTSSDWCSLHRAGSANLLLQVTDCNRANSKSLSSYLEQGIRRGVPQRYKCRVRTPWYKVPHVYEGDAFLTYMSGSTPKLVTNEANAVAPNTLHVLRLKPDSIDPSVSASKIAVSALSSLTALSFEIEGHSLGGGMLKLEPTEAERVLIAAPNLSPAALADLTQELDRFLRTGQKELARQTADRVILSDGLGLSAADMCTLKSGESLLRSRRLNR